MRQLYLVNPTVHEAPFSLLSRSLENSPLSKRVLLIFSHVMGAVQRVEETRVFQVRVEGEQGFPQVPARVIN